MRTSNVSGLALALAIATGCADGGGPLTELSAKEQLADDVATGETSIEEAAGGEDICTENGWYDDGVCDQFCPLEDPACTELALAPPAGEPVPARFSTRYPIVLLHGFNAGRSGLLSFHDVVRTLTNAGNVVYATEVPPFNTIRRRAEVLAPQIDQILAETRAAKVNLVTHSLGGLDARELVSVMGYGNRVASVSAIAAPYGGTGIADTILLAAITSPTRVALLRALARLLGRTYNDLANDENLIGGLLDLSTWSAPDFERTHPDVAGVYYQSWAGVSSVLALSNLESDLAQCGVITHGVPGSTDWLNPLLWPTNPFVTGFSRDPGDGVVSVASARRGPNFRGCIPADHYDTIGQPSREAPVAVTGFDHRAFYLRLAYELKQQGL